VTAIKQALKTFLINKL